MLILGSGCGWIPNATVNFIANIVGIIKVFVPLLIIIMGSIDFAKAIMSQKEDDIKKSQTNFIQKLIAGAAVFFVMISVYIISGGIDQDSSACISSCGCVLHLAKCCSGLSWLHSSRSKALGCLSVLFC